MALILVQLLLNAKVLPIEDDTKGIMNDIIINKLVAGADPPGVRRLEEGAEVSADSEDSGLAGGGYSFEEEQAAYEEGKHSEDKQSENKGLGSERGEEAYELAQLERIRVLKCAQQNDRIMKLQQALKHYQVPTEGHSQQDDEDNSGADYHI